MKRVFLTVLLCAAAARAEIKERIAAIVNGQPILLSDVEERIGSEASTLGLTVSEEELQRALEQLARQQGMELADFRQALEQQGIAWDTARDTVRRQTLMAEVLRFKVKARKVTDEEVQAAYATEAHNAQYEVRARHIFVPVPQNASPAQQAAALARAEQALRRVKAGEVSPVIRTGSGYHLVLVEDRRPIPPKPLADVKEELRNRLANDSVFKERENYLATLRKTAQIDEKL